MAVLRHVKNLPYVGRWYAPKCILNTGVIARGLSTSISISISKSLVSCKTLNYDTVLLQNIQIQHFLLQNVKKRQLFLQIVKIRYVLLQNVEIRHFFCKKLKYGTFSRNIKIWHFLSRKLCFLAMSKSNYWAIPNFYLDLN